MQKHAVQRSPRLPSVVIFSIHFPAITQGCIPASIQRTPTDNARHDPSGVNRVYTQTSAGKVIKYIWSTYVWSWDALTCIEGAGRDDAVAGKWCIPGQRFPFLLSISSPSPQAGAAPRGLFVFLPPSLQFRSAVPPPPTPSLTGSGVRQAFTPRNDYFLLPPSFPPSLLPSFAARRAKNPHSTPSVGCWHIWLSAR